MKNFSKKEIARNRFSGISIFNLYRLTSETSRVYRMRINQTFVGSVARFLSKIHQDMEKRMSYS